MSEFTYFKRGECPICSGKEKSCRRSNITELNFCRDAEANPTHYIDRGLDAHGFRMWQASEDAEKFKQQSEEDRRREQILWLERQASHKREKIARQLPAIERDKYYKQILEQMSLSDTHRQSLLNRGFTLEQIVKDGYRSVLPWQQVIGNFPQNLPGILHGNTLNVFQSAILCPIYNADGLIVGFQFRLDQDEDGRYRWLTSKTKKNEDGVTAHLNAELPITVLEPDTDSADSIWLPEGTGLKPSLARYKLNVPVIGAASGRFDTSPETSKESIDYLSAKYQTDLLTFPIDAGDILNKNGVPERWREQIEFFSSLGYQCQVAWWGQFSKDDCDIDELSDFSGIKYISPAKFYSLCPSLNKDINIIDIAVETTEINIVNNTETTEKRQEDTTDWAFERWKKSRTFTPTITINQPEFSFPPIPQNNAIISVKSAMGTGKTGAILEVIKQSPNKRAIFLGCLNNLLYQTISRGEDKEVKIYHLHKDEAGNLIADEGTNIATCVDSIHQLDGYFKGADIYIDENDSVIKHILSAGTLGDKQGYTIKVFERAIREGSRVFLLDANNNNLITNFFSEIAPNKEVVKILNTAKPRPHHFKFVNGYDGDEDNIKQRDKSPLIKLMRESGINPFIASDSRKFTNTIAELLKEAEKQGYALNRDTVNEDWAKLFLNNPDEFLTVKQPNFMAISPTANSGISITNKGIFTDKFTIFHGVLTTNQQTQILLRLRPNDINHYIFCPNFSTIKTGEKVSTPNTYKQRVMDKISLSMELANEDNNVSMAEIIGKKITECQDDIWFNLSCELGALDNYERDNLKKCLMFAVTEQGHTYEEINLEISKETKEEFKAAQDKVVRIHATEIHKSQPLESIEKAREVAKTSPKKEVMRRVERTILNDKLPGIENTPIFTIEFIESTLKNREFIANHQRYWMLNNLDISRKRSEVNWFFNATDEHFYLGSMTKDPHLKIWALQQLNVLQFTRGEYHKNSQEIIDFYNLATSDKKINTALGLTIGKPTVKGTERIKLVQQCLASIGLKLQFTGRKLIDGNKQYIYSLDQDVFNDEVRREILAAIDRKYNGYLESETVKKVVWEQEVIAQEVETMQVADTTIPGSVELMRETLADNSLDYGMLHSYFADFDHEVKKAIFNQLTIEEQAKIRAIQATSPGEQLAKQLLDAIKTRKRETIEAEFSRVRNSMGGLEPDEEQIMIDCLPAQYREILAA